MRLLWCRAPYSSFKGSYISELVIVPPLNQDTELKGELQQVPAPALTDERRIPGQLYRYTSSFATRTPSPSIWNSESGLTRLTSFLS